METLGPQARLCDRHRARERRHAVVLGRPASGLVEGEASATYNKLTVRVVGKAPKDVQRVEVFTLPGNEPIHPHVYEPADKARVIDHMAGWSDGHEGMSEDAKSDGHEGMDR